MKTLRTSFVWLLLVVVLCFFCSCNMVNPNVATKSDKGNDKSVSDKVGGSVPSYIKGDDLAKKSYELSFLLAQKKFNSPKEINVNAIVQYAFCHLNYDYLIDMPTSGLKMRTASVDSIKKEIKKHFGDVSVDVTKSDLYNGKNKCFEMWEPSYGTEIFYDVDVSSRGNKTYKVMTTFYTDSTKEEVLGKTILTVKDVKKKAIIQKLSSSN